MKHANKLWLILAVIALIGFVVISCDNGNGNGACTHTAGAVATCTTDQTCTTCGVVMQAKLGHDESGAAATCTTAKICAREDCDHILQATTHSIIGGICTGCGVLRLSGLDVVDEDDSGITEFTAATTSHNAYVPLTDLITGTPKVQITEGKLTIELDQPKSEHMQLAEAIFGSDAEPNDALTFSIFFNDDPDGYFELRLRSPDSDQHASLVYADKDVVLNSGYWNFSNLTLKKGWNYLIFDYNDNSTSSSQIHPEGFVWTIYED